MSEEIKFILSGFQDYTSFFMNIQGLWIFLGCVILMGTLVSIIPQLLLIVRTKSSKGLNAIYVFLTNLDHVFVFCNIISLQPTDFFGLIQYDKNISYNSKISYFN